MMGQAVLERRECQDLYEYEDVPAVVALSSGDLDAEDVGSAPDLLETSTPRILDCARIVLGVDLIVVHEVNLAKPTVRRIDVTVSEACTLDERRRLEATAEALDRFTYADWITVLDRMLYLKLGDDRFEYLKERRAIFNQEDLLPGLSRHLGDEARPYAGVSLWRSDPHGGQEELQYVSTAVWVQDGFEAKYPLSQAAEELDKALTLETLAPIARRPSTPVQFVADTIDAISAPGRTVIPLRRRLSRVYDPETSALYVEGFGPAFVGRGRNLNLAWSDFANQVGDCVESLRRTRPFNRTEQQERVWRLLCRGIDIQAYRDARPMRLFRIGTIKEAPRPDARVVVWEEDERREFVKRGQAPSAFFDLAKYPVERRFEAVVDYDRPTNSLNRIDEIRQLGPPITDQEAWKFWESIPRPREEQVDVRGEQVDVPEGAVVTEEVKVGKRVVQDTEAVPGQVRKEDVRVEQKGDVDVRNRGTGQKPK